MSDIIGQATPAQTEHFDWIADVFKNISALVSAGGNGLAGIIFVAVMVVIVVSLTFGTKITDGMVTIIKWFLTVGAVCVALSLFSSVVDGYFGAEYDLYVSVSPSLVTVGYPDPIVKADAVVVGLDQKFKVSKGMAINVIFDPTIEYLKTQNARLAQAQQEAQNAAMVGAQLQQAIELQQEQVARVKASVDTLKAGFDQREQLPDWAGGQLESITMNLDAISDVPKSDFFVKYDPAAVTFDAPAPNVNSGAMPG